MVNLNVLNKEFKNVVKEFDSNYNIGYQITSDLQRKKIVLENIKSNLEGWCKLGFEDPNKVANYYERVLTLMQNIEEALIMHKAEKLFMMVDSITAMVDHEGGKEICIEEYICELADGVGLNEELIDLYNDADFITEEILNRGYCIKAGIVEPEMYYIFSDK